MIQPARVLPSNAPPLRDNDGVHHASNVLREHSGNRQHPDFGFNNEYDRKYPSSILTENSYPLPHHQQLQHAPAPEYPRLYHPQPQQRQAWRYGHLRNIYRNPGPEREARIRFEAERLYQRFRKSEAYVKYRQRQSNTDKGNSEQKWPEHLEKAFFRALVQYPPMGRRKTYHKEKARGRNELIADCIEQLTGEERGRKQVSSHIQVLKPFVEHDPLIMKWLSKEDWGSRGDRLGGPNLASGRMMSTYHGNPPTHPSRIHMASMPRQDSISLQKLKGMPDVFEPTEFQMFVQRKHEIIGGHAEEPEKLHTYTQSVPNPLAPDYQIADWASFHREFPVLAAIDTQRSLDCTVISAEASIAFPVNETWKKEDGNAIPGVELGVSFTCSSRHLPPSANPVDHRGLQIVVNNVFYENGICAKDHSGPTDARLEPKDRGTGVETRIKFGSTFWAKTLGRLGGRLLDVTKDHREDVSTYLKSITAVQEVYAVLDHSQERLLVIHWKFRHSTTTLGRASWSRLLLPPQHGIPTKNERVDSMYEYSAPIAEMSSSHQHDAHDMPAPPPTLQSPFEYDSNSGSALSSATWPTSMSETSFVVSQSGTMDFTADNSFDFTGGNVNINLPYDPSLNFDDFDSSAFDFNATGDFAPDSTLQDYHEPWYDNGFGGGFDAPHSFSGDGATNFAAQPDVDGQTYHSFDGDYTHHNSYESQDHHAYSNGQDQHEFHVSNNHESQSFTSTQDHPSYAGTPHEHQQAYGGAGQDVMKDEDALVALADASFMASAMGPAKGEPVL